MIKIFLVEDEYVVREGIKNNIDWEKHGYCFCGEASDGERALPLIQKMNPDIVITDIRMPFMDGLALSKIIKKQMPATEIVILSGYAEFEYAKEGIKIGVAEYITKPVSGDELLRVIDGIALRIEQKRKEREIMEKYENEMEENLLADKKNFFMDLVTGNRSVPELHDLAAKLNMDLSALWYNIVLVWFRSVHHAPDEYSNSQVEMERRLAKLEHDDNIVLFDRNLEGYAILLKADSEQELLINQKNYLAKIENVMKEYPNIRYFGGIGECVNRLSELPASFEKASHAFAHRYLVKDNLFMDSIQIQQHIYYEKEDFNIRKVDVKQIERSRVWDFLKQGIRGEARYFVEEFFNGLDRATAESNLFRQYIIMDMFFGVTEFVDSLQLPSDVEVPLDVSLPDLQTMESTITYLSGIIETALSLRDRAASNRYGDVVKEVKKYIEENYADEELSLNLLANYVNFSPNHLSMIFSQETGMTFIRYLTDYRMNKAKELLRCTSLRSSAIGMEVGYHDPHYFSFLFKKTQGMTPTQFRGNRTIEGED